MRRILAAIVIAMGSGLFSSAHAGEKPLVLLFERDPWLMVVGSDSPVFVLYESGAVIYRDEKEGEQGGYKAVQLENGSVENFMRNQLEPLKELKDDYTLTNWTDQTTQEFFFSENEKSRKIFVYGSLKNEDVREKAPEPLLTLYDSLASFKREDVENWTPEYYEVMIWPYEYAPDESAIWPEKWPDINSGSTQKRRDSYSIYLPFEEREALIDFMGTIKEKGAVLMNDKKWALSVRTPFPHELPPDL